MVAKTWAKEFMAFLKEYKIVGVALAFVMGTASSSLVKSLVENIIMPLVTPFVPAGGWKNAVIHLGPFVIKWGAFLAEFINFVILSLVVFVIVKKILKEEKVTKEVIENKLVAKK